MVTVQGTEEIDTGGPVATNVLRTELLVASTATNVARPVVIQEMRLTCIRGRMSDLLTGSCV
jgi:hypothetical protein